MSGEQQQTVIAVPVVNRQSHATGDRVRLEPRVRLRVTFNDFGSGWINPPPCVALTPGWQGAEGFIARPKDAPPTVDVLVYESDVAKWEGMVEHEPALYTQAVQQYEAKLRAMIARTLGMSIDKVPADEALFTDEMRAVKAWWPGHPAVEFYQMRMRGFLPLASVEVVERGLAPPMSDAERAQELQAATTARAIREALGPMSGASPDVVAMMDAVAKLTAEVASLKSQLGIAPDAKPKK